MQRGIIFLILASLFRFSFTSSNLDAEDKENYVLVGLDAKVEDNLTDIDSDLEISVPGSRAPVAKVNANEENVSALRPSNEDLTIFNFNANARGRVGLVNGFNLCYMNAFISSIFNIHRFREALYSCEPENASTVFLAETFARLETSSAPVSTKMTLLQSLTNEMGWTFGSWQCNMEFGGALLDIMPKSIKTLYEISVRNEIYLRGTERLVTAVNGVEPYIIVPPTFPSVLEAVRSHFPDNDAGNTFIVERAEYETYRDFVEEPFEGDKTEIKVYRKHVISNRPEMMVFGIRRRNMEAFDRTEMQLNPEIVLPGLEEGSAPVVYHLHAFCYHTPGHYISYARDFSRGNLHGDWYQYNDTVVKAVRTVADYNKLVEAANRAATMAFYVRADVIMTPGNYHEIPIPSRIMTLSKLMTALEDAKTRITLANEKKKQEQKYRSPPPLTSSASPKSIDEVSSSTIIRSADRSNERNRSALLPELTFSNFMSFFPSSADIIIDDISVGLDRAVPEA